MRHVCLAIIGLAAFIPATAPAQVATMKFGPLWGDWEWADGPLHGRVIAIEHSREQPDQRTGELRARVTRRERIVHLSDGMILLPAAARRTSSTRTEFDAKGRRVRVQGGFAQGAGGPSVTYFETAEYDEKGNLTKLTGRETGKPPVELTGESTPAPDGGRTTTLRKPDGTTFTLVYNAKGQVVQISNVRQPTLFTYNDHGYVQSWGSTPTSGESFEYEYDDAGNWVRQSRYLKSDLAEGKKTPRDTQIRKLTYAAPEKQAVPGHEKVAGVYRKDSGDKQAMSFVNEFDLRKDGTGRVVVVSTVTDPEKAMLGVVNESELTWSLSGDTLTMTIIGSAADAAGPKKSEVLTATVTPDGLQPTGKHADQPDAGSGTPPIIRKVK